MRMHSVTVFALLFAMSFAPSTTVAQTGWGVNGRAESLVPLVVILGERSVIDGLKDVISADGWALVDEGVTQTGKRFAIYRSPATYEKQERLWREAERLGVLIGPLFERP